MYYRKLGVFIAQVRKSLSSINPLVIHPLISIKVGISEPGTFIFRMGIGIGNAVVWNIDIPYSINHIPY